MKSTDFSRKKKFTYPSRFVTKLVPKLTPEHQCTIVPQETCNLRFSQPQQVFRRLSIETLHIVHLKLFSV